VQDVDVHNLQQCSQTQLCTAVAGQFYVKTALLDCSQVTTAAAAAAASAAALPCSGAPAVVSLALTSLAVAPLAVLLVVYLGALESEPRECVVCDRCMTQP